MADLVRGKDGCLQRFPAVGAPNEYYSGDARSVIFFREPLLLTFEQPGELVHLGETWRAEATPTLASRTHPSSDAINAAISALAANQNRCKNFVLPDCLTLFFKQM